MAFILYPHTYIEIYRKKDQVTNIQSSFLNNEKNRRFAKRIMESGEVINDNMTTSAMPKTGYQIYHVIDISIINFQSKIITYNLM